MVEGRGTGIVYPCGNIDALAAAIGSVLQGARAFRAALPAINRAYSPAATVRGILDATLQLKREKSECG
jgi:hypothetical protein